MKDQAISSGKIFKNVSNVTTLAVVNPNHVINVQGVS